MKKLNLIYALVPLVAFASCKKDSPAKPETSTKPAVIAAVSDSVSYSMDGITYTAGGMGVSSLSAGSADANRKLIYPDSTKKYEYALVGNPDSIMYFQENRIISKSANINVFFVKKFLRQQTPLYFPGLNSVLTLFTVGKHPFAEDFGWQNSQNGLAIDVSANGKGYSSYIAYNGVGTIAVAPGFQKNSAFEITSFTEATDAYGGYNLEAKFNAIVFDANGTQKKLDNGYLRLHVDPVYAVNGK
jgi:hypothetical protein